MQASRGDLLIRLGSALCLIGMGFTVAAILPLFTSVQLPSALWGLSMITALGFGMVLAGLFRTSRQRARIQRSRGASG